VFAYLSVVYNTPSSGSKHTDNEMILWDAILPSANAAKLHLVNEAAKYKVNDISGKFSGRNATLRFAWNVQPHVGALYWGSVELGRDGVSEAEEGRKGEWGFEIPPAWGKKKTTAGSGAGKKA
jgi:signal peptidase complex subunit 3